jgi:hypothetical protein
MDTNPLRRPRRILLAVAGLATAMLVGACDTAQQVPWATYNSQLQQQIDAATATRDCAALRVYLAAAKASSSLHEKATVFPTTPSSPISRPASMRQTAPPRLADRMKRPRCASCPFS